MHARSKLGAQWNSTGRFSSHGRPNMLNWIDRMSPPALPCRDGANNGHAKLRTRLTRSCILERRVPLDRDSLDRWTTTVTKRVRHNPIRPR